MYKKNDLILKRLRKLKGKKLYVPFILDKKYYYDDDDDDLPFGVIDDYFHNNLDFISDFISIKFGLYVKFYSYRFDFKNKFIFVDFYFPELDYYNDYSVCFKFSKDLKSLKIVSVRYSYVPEVIII